MKVPPCQQDHGAEVEPKFRTMTDETWSARRDGNALKRSLGGGKKGRLRNRTGPRHSASINGYCANSVGVRVTDLPTSLGLATT